MIVPNQAVVFCGGRGTRLLPLTKELPKPMVDINGKPFLWYLLEQISTYGVRDFVLLTGYLGSQISDYFGNGSEWGWKIRYSHGPAEWETGKRLLEARSLLSSSFLLFYSDNFVQARFDMAIGRWWESTSPVCVHLVPKERGNIFYTPETGVESYDVNRNGVGYSHVEVGYMLVNRDFVLRELDSMKNESNPSFSLVLKSLAGKGKLSGHVVRDNYHSIGDLSRYERTKNYLRPKKIILLDRDGIINQKKNRGQYVTEWAEFVWIKKTRDELRKLTKLGYSFVVITNQAGVSRGMVKEECLKEIHEKMVAELKNDGVEVLGVYSCTDHWETHSFRRKPNPGMFFEVARDFNLRLDKTVYIGDDSRDCEAAYNANTKCFHVGPISELETLPFKMLPERNYPEFPSADLIDRFLGELA